MEPREKEKLQKWITSAQNGNQTDFRNLYEYSFPAVQAECRKILRTPADTEDGIQESYLKIYRNLKSLKYPETFLPWCRRIAHNVCVDYVISQQRKHGKDDYKPPVSEDQYEGLDRLSLEDPDDSPEEQAERRDNQEHLQTILQTAMDEIPAQRALCLALYQQGNSQKEISRQLRIPVGTVKSNIHYAKQALRRKIEQIEREEHTQIHGLVLIPSGTTAIVRLKPESSGFIRARTVAKPVSSGALWKSLSKTLFPAALPKLWPKILVTLLTIAIIGGGIGFAVHITGPQAKKSESATTHKTTTATQLSRVSQSETEPARLFRPASEAEQTSQTISASLPSVHPGRPNGVNVRTKSDGSRDVEYFYSQNGTTRTTVVSYEQYQKDQNTWQ